MTKISKQVLFCTIGTVFEWYDFSLFVYLTPIISILFFPKSNHFAAMLSTLAIFATGYLARPVGAVFFGHLGDTRGRKSTLLISIFLMAIATTGIGLIPTGTSFSMLFLILCRLLQGFSTSGEYPGGITLLAEQDASKHRAFVTSFGVFATGMGIFVGSLVYAILLKGLGYQTMLGWGWRIPFLLALPLGLLSYFLRRTMVESKDFMENRKAGVMSKRFPIMELLQTHYKKLSAVLFLYILSNIIVYINIAYFGNYALAMHKLDADNLMYLNLLIAFIYSAAILVFGFLADYINKKGLMIFACVGMIVFTFPLFFLALKGTVALQFLAQSVIALLLGMLLGPLANVAATVFPVSIRYTSMGFVLNISASIFGGTAPFVCAWLTNISGTPLAAAIYVIFFAISAFISLFVII